MTWEIRFLVTLFAVMFFWIANTEAFAGIMTCTTSSSGVTECVSGGTIVIIHK
jgi:hypothetical protein